MKKKIHIELNGGDEVLDRDIKEFGSASHVILPKKHKGKKAKVIIKEHKKEHKANGKAK